MPDTSIIDPHAIESLRALNPGDSDEFLREISTIFLEDTPLRLAELEESLRAGDVVRFSRAAHSIKGSAANLGASGLRAAAEQLEHQSRTAGLIGVAPLVDTLKVEFAKAQAAITQLIAK